QAGAAIENKLRAVRRSEFETRRVSTVAPGGGIHGRRRTAHSPEAQLGDRTAHRLFKTPEAVRLNRRAAFATVPGGFALQICVTRVVTQVYFDTVSGNRERQLIR